MDQTWTKRGPDACCEDSAWGQQRLLLAYRGAGLPDAVLVDARTDLVAARRLYRLLGGTGMDVPAIAVLTEGGLVGVSGEWVVDEILVSRHS